MRILVVDDSVTIRIMLQEILSRYAEVDSRADGAEALQACTNALDFGDPYDLIFLDLLMPNMGGLEALQLIRQAEERHGRTRSQGAKVIIATASDDSDSINNAFQSLCDAYIVKPFDCTELINILYCLCPIEERAPHVAG